MSSAPASGLMVAAFAVCLGPRVRRPQPLQNRHCASVLDPQSPPPLREVRRPRRHLRSREATTDTNGISAVGLAARRPTSSHRGPQIFGAARRVVTFRRMCGPRRVAPVAASRGTSSSTRTASPGRHPRRRRASSPRPPSTGSAQRPQLMELALLSPASPARISIRPRPTPGPLVCGRGPSRQHHHDGMDTNDAWWRPLLTSSGGRAEFRSHQRFARTLDARRLAINVVPVGRHGVSRSRRCSSATTHAGSAARPPHPGPPPFVATGRLSIGSLRKGLFGFGSVESEPGRRDPGGQPRHGPRVSSGRSCRPARRRHGLARKDWRGAPPTRCCSLLVRTPRRRQHAAKADRIGDAASGGTNKSTLCWGVDTCSRRKA